MWWSRWDVDRFGRVGARRISRRGVQEVSAVEQGLEVALDGCAAADAGEDES